MNVEPFISPYIPYQNTAPPLRSAVLLMNVELTRSPYLAPKVHSIAPPLLPAWLKVKLELLTVVFSQRILSSYLWRNIAPPRHLAELLSKLHSSMRPLEPDHMIAPPSPPVVFSPYGVMPYSCPLAVLFVKLDFLTVPLIPFQNIAPPVRLAILLMNTESSTVPYLAPLNQSIAPPFVRAMFESKVQFFTVTFSQ